MFSVIKEITQNCARTDMIKLKVQSRLFTLSKGLKFGIKQIESLLLLERVCFC